MGPVSLFWAADGGRAAFPPGFVHRGDPVGECRAAPQPPVVVAVRGGVDLGQEAEGRVGVEGHLPVDLVPEDAGEILGVGFP